MEQRQIDQRVFSLAKEFLIARLKENPLLPEGKSAEEVLSLQTVAHGVTRPNDVTKIYRRLIESASNSNQMPGVVLKSVDGELDAYESLLGGFDPSYVLTTYDDWESLLDKIVADLQPNGKIRREPKSLWPRFCKSILSCAKFMCQFDSPKQFYDWVNVFYKDERSKYALPALLAHELVGLGFPLACDFLKELGFNRYGKPDVHVKKAFYGIGLCDSEDDYLVAKTISRVAQNCGVPEYEIDKVFWLIGSGRFYDFRDLKTGRNRDKFIKLAVEEIN